ncbi:ribulose-phosphate 3-epimerase [Escherichia coli]|uniref:Ribulose-phosphate 3-epimerase n=2 Tax=Enterobacterales TaxID=91347 RepID=A0A264VNW7_PRORE|nr:MULTISPECIES: ribulose-phosphate 3-epimerase [Enterobacterales]HCC1004248.1 ribulose-phosphate 3-epimerase [Salmonella enterica subsp. enterica serovar Choleraesuis]EEX2877722.1 ribulose-phosphate 3-epimerase [Escherichia coli]EFE0762013.1 ribulose-phosphate 3-epimerase [Escherichia coli]EFJ2476011.1 ribulose-phosphate 3-epimerase [Escherichia coli]EFJ2485263.1 ribulose-phosphate 3-epimerase [Escherichia coli]
MRLLGASLMCADFLKLGGQILELEKGGIDFYHIDIMDGQFVDNFALSIDFIRSIKPLTTRPIDVHLMVDKPERYIEPLVKAGADIITVHAEAVTHLHGVLSTIRSHGVKAGVALNPSTHVESLGYVVDLIDVLLIMTVNPGFAGQKFIDTMHEKIRFAHTWLKEHGSNAVIEVDGNIGHHTIPPCVAEGAGMFVLGTSALFHNRGTIAENLAETRAITDTVQMES